MYYCQKPRDTFLKEIEKISNKVQTIGSVTNGLHKWKVNMY